MRPLLFATMFVFMLCRLYGVDVPPPPSIEDVIFKSEADRTEQRFVEIRPGSFKSENTYDLLVGLHGQGGDRWQFVKDKRDECAVFRSVAAKYGMIAVSPEYRGRNSWLGSLAEADVVQIIKDSKKKYKIGRVIICGIGSGGSSALTFAVLHPGMVSGVVAMNPIADYVEFEGAADSMRSSFGTNKLDSLSEYKRRSPELQYKKLLKIPVAVTVGILDNVYPPQSAMRLADKLESENGIAMLIKNGRAGHVTNINDATAAFLFVLEKTSVRK